MPLKWILRMEFKCDDCGKINSRIVPHYYLDKVMGKSGEAAVKVEMLWSGWTCSSDEKVWHCSKCSEKVRGEPR